MMQPGAGGILNLSTPLIGLNQKAADPALVGGGSWGKKGGRDHTVGAEALTEQTEQAACKSRTSSLSGRGSRAVDGERFNGTPWAHTLTFKAAMNSSADRPSRCTRGWD